MNIIKLLNIPTKKNKYGLEKTHRLLKECKLNDNNFIKIQIIGTKVIPEFGVMIQFSLIIAIIAAIIISARTKLDIFPKL